MAALEPTALLLGQPHGLACRSLAIESLRLTGGAASIVQGQHLDDPILVTATQRNRAPYAQQPRRLASLTIDLDMAGLNRGLGQRTRLVKARGPQPDIQSQAAADRLWVQVTPSSINRLTRRMKPAGSSS